MPLKYAFLNSRRRYPEELQAELTEHAHVIVRLSALLLQNLKTNAANRTVFYKAELRGTALREAGGGDGLQAEFGHV